MQEFARLAEKGSTMESDRKHRFGGRGPGVISHELEQAIQTGMYAHGDRLPAERELADQFQTSRSTVRQALQHLESSNLVVRRKGSGTFVTYVPPSDDTHVAEMTNPLQLVDVRFALEPQIVRLAVLNANSRDLDHVDQILRRFDPEQPSQEAFATIDEAFHQMLADCTGNPLITELYRQVNRVRTLAQWNAMKIAILTPERMRAYHDEHVMIFEALKTRDKEAAERAMRQHLDRIHRELLGADAR